MMTKQILVFAALAGAVSLTHSQPAAAGAYVEASSTNLLAPLQAPRTERMWFDSGKFRLESESGDVVEIFRDGTLYLVQPRTGHLSALQPADAPDPDRHVTRTDRSESVAGVSCRIWEVALGGEKVREWCIAEPDTLPGGAEIAATLRELSGFAGSFEHGAARDQDSLIGVWADWAGEGIPLIVRTFVAGRPALEVRLTALRSEPVPLTAFDVPAAKHHANASHAHALATERTS